MGWEFVVVLIAIPVLCLPVAFIWLLNIGSVPHVLQDIRKRRAAAEKERITEKRLAKTTCGS